jgi:hypothetical protein
LPPSPIDAALRPHQVAIDAGTPAPPESVRGRWRHARLLRGQGKFKEALAECLAIADLDEPTWSPIALVDAIPDRARPRCIA